MKKRLIALLLAGTMAISLAACGGSGDSGSSTPSDSSGDVKQSQESTPESTPESKPDESAPPR